MLPQPPADVGPRALERLERRAAAARLRAGRPAVARPARPEQEAVLWNGPVLELARTRASRRLGPDILAEPLDLDRHAREPARAPTRPRARRRAPRPAARRRDREHVEGRGALAGAGLALAAPRRRDRRRAARSRSREAARLDARVARRAGRAARRVYRRAGRPCPRCGAPIRSRGQGDDNRDRVLVPAAASEARTPPARRKENGRGAARSPHLYELPARFCLGAFALLDREVEAGARAPVRLRGARAPRPARRSTSTGRSSRAFVEARAERLAELEDARLALEELRREPAAAIFARAHAGARPTEERGALPDVLLPLLVGAAEALRRLRLGRRRLRPRLRRARALALRRAARLRARSRRSSASPPAPGRARRGTACAPARRRRAGRALARGERAAAARASAASPSGSCVLELERELPGRRVEPPDAPGELADAVTALRLATAAPGRGRARSSSSGSTGVRSASGRCCRSPRPSLPGEPTRLDEFRGRLAATCSRASPRADDDPELGEALDRWELSLFQPSRSASEQLRESLGRAARRRRRALGGGAARRRCCSARPARARRAARPAARPASGGHASGAPTVRRALVEVLMHGDRPG